MLSRIVITVTAVAFLLLSPLQNLDCSKKTTAVTVAAAVVALNKLALSFQPGSAVNCCQNAAVVTVSTLSLLSPLSLVTASKPIQFSAPKLLPLSLFLHKYRCRSFQKVSPPQELLIASPFALPLQSFAQLPLSALQNRYSFHRPCAFAIASPLA